MGLYGLIGASGERVCGGRAGERERRGGGERVGVDRNVPPSAHNDDHDVFYLFLQKQNRSRAPYIP
jgi:hypothetical protein